MGRGGGGDELGGGGGGGGGDGAGSAGGTDTVSIRTFGSSACAAPGNAHNNAAPTTAHPRPIHPMIFRIPQTGVSVFFGAKSRRKQLEIPARRWSPGVRPHCLERTIIPPPRSTYCPDLGIAEGATFTLATAKGRCRRHRRRRRPIASAAARVHPPRPAPHRCSSPRVYCCSSRRLAPHRARRSHRHPSPRCREARARGRRESSLAHRVPPKADSAEVTQAPRASATAHPRTPIRGRPSEDAYVNRRHHVGLVHAEGIALGGAAPAIGRHGDAARGDVGRE